MHVLLAVAHTPSNRLASVSSRVLLTVKMAAWATGGGQTPATATRTSDSNDTSRRDRAAMHPPLAQQHTRSARQPPLATPPGSGGRTRRRRRGAGPAPPGALSLRPEGRPGI